MATDSEVSAIVLSIDSSNKTVFCYSEGLNSAITVRLSLAFEKLRGYRILFWGYKDADEMYIPTSMNDAKIQCSIDDNVSIVENEVLIRAKVACSTDKSHSTYSTMKAYGGQYGIIDVAGKTIERGCTYIADLIVNSPNNQKGNVPVFKIKMLGDKLEGKEADLFLLKLYDWEETLEKCQELKLAELDVSSKNQEFQNLNQNQEFLDISETADQFSKHSEVPPTPEFNQISETPSPNTPTWEEGASSEYRSLGNKSSVKSIDEQTDSTAEQGKKFGRMLTKPAVPETSKNGVEHCLLILHVDKNQLIGFDTTNLTLIRVNTANLRTAPIIPFMKFRFIEDGVRDGQIIAERNSVRISELDGIQFLDAKQPMFEANLVFSSNPKHRSYNKSVAVSDEYGLVAMPESNDVSIKKMFVYRGLITLAQIEDPLIPIFTLVSLLPPCPQPHNDDHLFEIITNFEEDLYNRTKQAGLGSHGFPLAGYIPEPVKNSEFRRENRKNCKLENEYVNRTGSAKRENVEGHQYGVVVSTARISEGVYGTIWTPIGDAYFTEKPTVYNTRECIKDTQLILMRLERVGGKLFVDKVIEICEEGENFKVVYNKEGDYYTIHTYLVLSMTLSKSDSICFYKHFILGIIRADVRDLQHHSNGKNCVLVECFRQIVPSRVPNSSDICYWYANSFVLPENRTIPPHDNRYKDKQLEMQRQYPPSTNIEFSENDFLRPNQVSSTKYQGMNQMLKNNDPVMHNDEREFLVNMPSEEIESFALVTTRYNRYQIVYLRCNGEAAIHDFKKFKLTTRLGQILRCKAKKIPIRQDTMYAAFTITEVLEILEEHNEVRIHENECHQITKLDISHSNSIFTPFDEMGGNPIVKSEDFNYVIMADFVSDVRKRQTPAHDILELYKNKDTGKDMMGFVRFVRKQVPRVMFYPTYRDRTELMFEYVWELMSIVGKQEVYMARQADIKKKNLGDESNDKFRNYEQDDDIERQKRRAKMEDETRQQSHGSIYSRSDYSTQTFATARESPTLFHFPSQTHLDENGIRTMSAICNLAKKFMENVDVKSAMKAVSIPDCELFENLLKKGTEYINQQNGKHS